MIKMHFYAVNDHFYPQKWRIFDQKRFCFDFVSKKRPIFDNFDIILGRKDSFFMVDDHFLL